MQQLPGNSSIFILFRMIRFLPFLAAGFLVASIVLWIIFVKKRSRWTKVVAIILTILLVVTGAFSIFTMIKGSQNPVIERPSDKEIFREWQQGMPGDRDRPGVESSGISSKDIHKFLA